MTRFNSCLAIVIATFVIVGVLGVPVVVAQDTQSVAVPVQDNGETLNVVLHSPNPLNVAFWVLGALIVGFFGGVLFAIKNPIDVLYSLEENNPNAFAYLVLGWLSLLVVGVLGWIGLVVVLVIFGLYHSMKGALNQSIRDAVASVRLPKRKPKDNTLPSDVVDEKPHEATLMADDDPRETLTENADDGEPNQNG